MLKTFCGIILVLVFLAIGSAYVTPTYASSTTILITAIDPGVTSPDKESIVIANISQDDIDITNWCFVNKTNKPFACFEQPGGKRIMLASGGFAVAVSATYDTGQNEERSLIYPSGGVNGSIVSSTDSIYLVDAQGGVIDEHSWSSRSGKGVTQRKIEIDTPFEFIDTDTSSDWVHLSSTAGALVLPSIATYIEDDLTYKPDSPDNANDEDSLVPPTLRFSELLPNPKGADSGKEYIELINIGLEPQSLRDYAIKIGPSHEKLKSIALLPDNIIPAGEYGVIWNSDVAFTLPNTKVTYVQLLYADEVVHEVAYENAKDDAAWAYIDGVWQYTRTATPGYSNEMGAFSQASGVGSIKNLKPCAANQYRHPDTNRCRLIQVAAVKKPCDEGSVRNPTTGRCRKIPVAAAKAPCKQGQERNASTGRCRNIKKMSASPYGVTSAQETDESGRAVYMWVTMGIIAASIGVYGVWEWREDILRLLTKVRSRFAKTQK